jgi:hypothetical protein
MSKVGVDGSKWARNDSESAGICGQYLELRAVLSGAGISWNWLDFA